MSEFTFEVGSDGVAVIRFDVAGERFNVISRRVQEAFDAVIEALRDREDVRGAVLMSGKESGFCAGADLREFHADMGRWAAAETPAELQQAMAEASSWSQRVRALETCGKPVAAIVQGVALGGGLELLLGCHYRVAPAGAFPRLALPETGVGLFPGAGGTQRLPRLLGLTRSLSHLIHGVPLEENEALASGVIHALVPEADLIDHARQWVLDHPEATAPWDAKGFCVPFGGAHGVDAYRNFAPAMAACLANDGDKHPAIGHVLKCVYEGAQVPMDAGLRIEARYFLATVRKASARAMARTHFIDRQVLARRERRADPEPFLAALRAAVDGQCAAMLKMGVPPGVVTRMKSLAGTTEIDSGSVFPVVSPGEIDMDLPARVRERLLYVQAVAAVRSLEDGLVPDRLEADAIAIKAGFPAWTGGPLSWIAVEGVARFIGRADALAAEHGAAFVLPDAARSGLAEWVAHSD